MKPSELLDDVERFSTDDDSERGRAEFPVSPDDAARAFAGNLERRCLICGKPGLRYNARVHPGACRRERRRFMQFELRRRRHRR